MFAEQHWLVSSLVLFLIFSLFTVILLSLRRIGPTEVGLVTKRFSFRRLTNDNIMAWWI